MQGPENPQFDSERLNRFISEIPWPTAVYTDDLTKITTFRRRGNSLAAAVSNQIIEEERDIIHGFIRERMREGHAFALRSLPAVTLIGSAYVLPARAFLAAEGKVGDLSSEGISLELEDVIEVLKPIQKLINSPDSPEEAFLDESEVALGVSEAGGETIAILLAQRLIKTAPLEVVDFYTDSQFQKFQNSENNDESQTMQAVVAAFDKGRQRFHQLYNASQEATFN